MNLGILDFGMVLPGTDAATVLGQSAALAARAEMLGYTRYWLVEHHERHYSWASPEIMLAVLGRCTTRIRIGSAAILLPLYSPLKVAEVFRLLATLYPGRIDMGTCASVPLDPVALRALLDDRDVANPSADYARKLEQLLAYVAGDFPPGHRFAAGATPCGPAMPQAWAMGTGAGSMTLAAKNGTAFSYSLFHRASAQDPALIRQYRDRFRPSPLLAEPCAGIAFAGVVAETDAAARIQKARAEQMLDGSMRINVSGTPADCAAQLRELAERYDTQDLVFHSLWDDYGRRAESYELLIEALRGIDVVPSGPAISAPA